MEEEFAKRFLEGFELLADMANWAFIVFNMLWIFILNMLYGKRSKNPKKMFKFELFLNKIPRTGYVIIQSIILAIFWEQLFGISSTNVNVYGELFVSITISMVIWKLGFHKLMDIKITKR